MAEPAVTVRRRILRFFLVGSIGFLVDSSAFTALLRWLDEPHAARFASFLVAVGATFFLNRRYTFVTARHGRLSTYVLVQAAGMAINMAVFAAVIRHPVWLPWQYYLGLVAGSLTAMVFNYEMSRLYVFR